MSTVSLSQSAYIQIRADILKGKIAPNTILIERDLAASLGISRTPLRSALSALEREQVIERMVNGTILVRKISVEHLLDIIQLRRTLEKAAAGRAAGFGMIPELSTARARQLRYLEDNAASFEDFWADDGDFHLAVAMAARLTLLPDLLTEQRAIVRRSTIIQTDSTFADQAREHISVIDAIATGDPAAASAAMARHFEHMRARTMGWLNKD